MVYKYSKVLHAKTPSDTSVSKGVIFIKKIVVFNYLTIIQINN